MSDAVIWPRYSFCSVPGVNLDSGSSHRDSHRVDLKSHRVQRQHMETEEPAKMENSFMAFSDRIPLPVCSIALDGAQRLDPAIIHSPCSNAHAQRTVLSCQWQTHLVSRVAELVDVGHDGQSLDRHECLLSGDASSSRARGMGLGADLCTGMVFGSNFCQTTTFFLINFTTSTGTRD